MEKRFWFKKKKFGYGWSPSTWEGWSVILLYISVVVSAIYNFNPEEGRTEIITFFAIWTMATILLLVICITHGEPLGGIGQLFGSKDKEGK